MIVKIDVGGAIAISTKADEIDCEKMNIFLLLYKK